MRLWTAFLAAIAVWRPGEGSALGWASLNSWATCSVISWSPPICATCCATSASSRRVGSRFSAASVSCSWRTAGRFRMLISPDSSTWGGWPARISATAVSTSRSVRVRAFGSGSSATASSSAILTMSADASGASGAASVTVTGCGEAVALSPAVSVSCEGVEGSWDASGASATCARCS